MLCLPNCFYRPQRSWAKVMFLQASVILSTGGGCLPQCMLGYTPPPGADTPPPGADTPQEQNPREQDTPPRSRHSPEQTPTQEQPPRADTPPPQQTPLGADPPRSRHPLRSRHPREADTPPPEADSGIRSTSGRYAAYWNAFLLIISNITFNLSDGDNRMR